MTTLAGPDAATASAAAKSEKNRKSIAGGASWFYWVGGLSLINSAALLFKIDVVFLVGLGITQIFDALGALAAEQSPSMALVARGFAVALDLGAAALFLTFGLHAHRGRTWAFVAGLSLYACDALIVMMAQDWIGLGFHAWALLGISGGYAALRRERADQALAAAPAALPATIVAPAREVRIRGRV